MPQVHTDKLFALLSTPELRDLNNDVGRLGSRILGLGLSRTCTRCSGSGHHSKNRMGSTTCYKCNGKTVTPPLHNARLVAQVEEKIANGAFDTYIADIKVKSQQRRDASKIQGKVTDLYSSRGWYKTFYGEEKVGFSSVGYLMNDLVWKPAEEAVSEALRKNEYADALAAFDALVEASANLDKAILAFVADGGVAADRERSIAHKANQKRATSGWELGKIDDAYYMETKAIAESYLKKVS